MSGRKSTEQAEQIIEIKTTLDALKDNVTGIQEELRVMNKTLLVNTEQLAVHIEGVRLAREQNELLRKETEARLQPIQDHVVRVNFIGKILALLIGAPAALFYVIQILKAVLATK